MTAINSIAAIEMAVAEVTDQHTANCGAKFGPVAAGEKIVATVESREIRALWTAAEMLKARVAMKYNEAELDGSPERLREARREAWRAADLCDVLREIFWFEAKEETGVWDIPALNTDETSGVGMRNGWMLVLRPASTNPLIKLLGGGIIEGD